MVRQACAETPSVPLCKFSASRPLSCTMKLDIIPWCLLVNSLGYPIKIVDAANENDCYIPSNGIATPCNITHAFTIQIQSNDQWIATQAIAINDEKLAHRQNMLHLPDDGTVILTNLVINNQLIKLCVTSTSENSTRIITIAPFYVICNLTKYPMKFHAFGVNRNERCKYDDMARLLRAKSQMKSIPDNDMASSTFKGCDCSIFVDLTQKPFKAVNVARDFNFYLIVGHDDGYLATPINLNKPIIRTSFGLRVAEKNVNISWIS